MRILRLLIASSIAMFVLSMNVFAASGSLGVSASNVHVGDSFTVTVNVNSAAAWNIHVSASGPVSGCSINQADASSDAMDTNKSFSTSCKATGAGKITITLSGDVTSAASGNAVNVASSKSVTVTQKPTSSSSTSTSTNTNASAKTNTNTRVSVDTRSNNNKIKELAIEGYELTKIDDYNYVVSVPNYITSVNVVATAEDSRTTVAGAGSHDVVVGENNIEVVATAENGLQNKIIIKVTRKDGYYLEDLDAVLSDNKNDDTEIIIASDTKITASDLNKIRNSGRIVRFSFYDENKKMVYSWVVDGSRLGDVNELLTIISGESSSEKEVSRLSNYADGLFVEQKQVNGLSSGIRIKLFVGHKYQDGELVNVYTYVKNTDKLELAGDELKVEHGYIEFDAADVSGYLVTMSNLSKMSCSDASTDSNDGLSSIFLFIISFLSFLAIGLVIVLILKNKKDNNKNADIVFGEY